MKNTLELIKEFCQFDFVQRSSEKALALLSEDICWFGTGEHEDVHSKEEARSYLEKEIAAAPEPYELCLLEESFSPIGSEGGVAFLRARFSYNNVVLMIRITAASRMENGAEKLCSIHFSVADTQQQENEYFPLEQQRMKEEQEKRDLVLSTLAGGMMGGYYEEHFPFYFINNHMLNYLGYQNEEEFIADIGGYIENTMHPDDRELVNEAVQRQLAVQENYVVDYRMRKRDGTYIWIHDIGKLAADNNGRDVILSVCYDVTAEHAKQSQMENVLDALPGGTALYRYEDGEMRLIYQSKDMAMIAGYSNEEYKEWIADSAKVSIHPDDVERVWAAIAQAVAGDSSVSLDYRVPHKNGGYVWINGSFRRTRTEDGVPIVHAVYTEMPQLRELMTEITDNSGAAIVVTDNKTNELLYLNKTVSQALCTDTKDYSGKVCYEFLLGADKPCAFCAGLLACAKAGGQMEIYSDRTGKSFQVEGHIVTWAGREARIEYLMDVTASKTAQKKNVEIIENIACGLCVSVIRPGTRKLEYQYINKSFCELLELAPDKVLEAIEESITYGIHQDDLPSVSKAIDSLYQGVPKCAITFRYLLPDGRIKWINEIINCVKQPDGSTLLYASFNDITDLKEAQAQLDELVNNITAGVAVRSIDPNTHATRVQYVNKGLCDLLESTKQELSDRFEKDDGSFVDEVGRQMLHNMAVALKNGEPHVDGTVSCKTPSGKQKWLHLNVNTVLQQDGTLTAYTTYIDMTTQVEQQAQLQDVIRNVPGGVCLYRWNGVRLEPLVVSDQFSALLGEDARSSLDNTPDTTFRHAHPDDLPRLQREVVDGFRTGKIETVYRSLNSITGEYLYIQLRGTAVPQADGTQLAYVSYSDITAERLNAQKLRASERILEAATEHAGLWYWTFDPATDKAYFSERCIRDFGFPPVMENFPESWLKKGRVLSEYCDIFRNAVRDIKREAGEANFEAQVKMKDNLPHWNEFRFKYLPNEDGTPGLAVCTARIIDEQKAAQTRYELESQKPSLGEQDLLYHSAMNLTTGQTIDHVYHVENQDLAKENITIEKITQYVASRIVDAADREKFIRLNQLPTLREMAQRGENRYSMDYRRRMPDGRILWVRNLWSIVQNPNSDELILFAYCYNIHAQKMLSEILSRSTSLSYIALSSLYLDSDQAMLHIAGGEQNTNEFLPYDKFRHIHAERIADRVERQDYLYNTDPKTIIEQLKKSDTYFFLTKVKQPDGSLVIYRTQLYSYDRENNICVLTVSNVTELLKQEEQKKDQLTQALEVAQQANRAKTDFLSAMSHDIRTPMNAIVGMCELALENERDSAQVHESLQTIQSSSQILLSLINNILDMSRIESGKLVLNEAPFSLKAQVQKTADSYRILAQQKKQQFQLHTSISHDSCYADVARIHSAIDNIVSNAIKYTPEGGTVTYRVTELPYEKSGIGLYHFEISDTGIGISEAAQAHIFEPFYRGEGGIDPNTQGTGLGLSITKEIVELKGGTISVKSAVNVGTTFIVELPLHFSTEKVPDDSAQAKKSAQERDLTGIHILVCEDHPVNQKVVARILEKAHASVTIAANGQEGYEKFVQSLPGTYQMIFMDIRMPVMDGYEATAAIRASTHAQAKTIPIVALSANAFAENVQKSLQHGMNAHIAKPVVPQQIYDAVATFCADSKIVVKKKVLFVDDAELNIAVLTVNLQDDYEVLVARNGAEALNLLEQHPDISAVITDLMMPEMDGITLIKTIRANDRYNHIAVLANTQYGGVQQEQALRQIGADDFLYKPTTPQVVEKRLKAALQKHSSGL
ncbi:MAG: PAS domain-containing protein [Eubacteriales bacterium]|nr:PAS domain-containing protein [Eubacteriales bacterium]